MSEIAAEFETYYRLGLALFIGLLIGTERGWQTREAASGQRAAGIRTFALIGLFGGLAALLGGTIGDLVVVAAFFGLLALTVAAYVLDRRATDSDRGLTTEMAQLVTFALGAYAVLGEMALAAIGGVATVVLLRAKDELHGLLQHLERLELNGAIRLLVISVVVLPLLPDRGFGPGAVLNPRELWWMVVLISLVSFAGYFSVKLVGPRAGPLISGAFGGLASSTAVALGFSRLAAREPALGGGLAAGIAIAGALMFVRVPIVASFADRDVALALAVPMGIMATAALVVAFLIARGAVKAEPPMPAGIRDPADIASALKFGVFLLILTLVAHFLHQRYGDEGLYAVALAAGLADVDAITLTIARGAAEGDGQDVAVRAILLAVVSNTLVKMAIPAVIAGRALAWRVAVSLGGGLAAGAVALVVL